MSFIAKILGKIDYLRREIVLFKYCEKYTIPEFTEHQEFIYQEINNIKCFSNLVLNFDAVDYQDRFLRNHIICCYVYENHVITYGWINVNSTHYLGELDLEMDLNERYEVLYDFHTNIDYRGKGLYPKLLVQMCLRNSKNKLIYSFAQNKNSIRGIEKAGFKYLGKLRGFSKNKYQSLIKH